MVAEIAAKPLTTFSYVTFDVAGTVIDFEAAFTTDDTGTEKPDPAFFQQVCAHVAKDGGVQNDMPHSAQSQCHDIEISDALGTTAAWIERRHAQTGCGGTIEPRSFAKPDYHFHALIELADASVQA